jgi:hypothetical protein
MTQRLSSHIRGSRIPAIAAVAMLALALTIPGRLAQARVYAPDGRTIAVLSPDTTAFATGGGTVTVDVTTVASFGINAKRPDGTFTSGAAQGRINYDRHANVTAGRHVNVPVNFMQAEINPTPGSPNGTGGRAQLGGSCSDVGAQCPTGVGGVLVSVADNSDSGAGSDTFTITFCTTGGTAGNPPTGCGSPEATGPFLRTGNIQIRSSGPSAAGGGTALTAARAPLRLP